MEHTIRPFSITDRGPLLLGIDAAALGLALIATSLRCYVRVCLVKAFGVDDWLMAAAMTTFAAYCSFSITGVTYGTGQHIEDLPPENNATAKKWWWCCYLAYSATMILSKLSIAYFLLRVTINRVHRWIIYFSAIITVASCAVFFFVSLFQCHPVSYFWTRHMDPDGGTCINFQVVIALAYLFSAMSIMSDFTFALLPAWIVSHLNMRPRTKAALITLMGMGCLASAAVVVRLPYMHHIASDDFLYDTTDIAIWSTVEQCLAITAGCLATLQPLAKSIGYKLGLTTRPTLPLSNSVYKMTAGEISVRRSFTRRTETFSSCAVNLRGIPLETGGLKLQPGISGYTAMCYNTGGTGSQEELRPTEVERAETGASDPNSKGEEDVAVTVAVRTKEGSP
ncbi:hypothetical protein QBC40DRAFT_179759 [Triangularia verruculosa]|uniref:Rhodopsin domain-containing protein n=1 Tax=Triangularia verruculosa TaxID=2587418 RepID=A0AAN6XCG9_9PEZI|nr:hypothetical protein QBC40DRAFT_179759 [Triangularia verruculosa]